MKGRCLGLAVAAAIAISASACGGVGLGEPSPSGQNVASDSPLIVEETTPEPVPARSAVIPEGDYYKPPGWDGSDVNCSAFDTRAHAQSFFEGTGGSRFRDDFGLDGDHDEVACEQLP